MIDPTAILDFPIVHGLLGQTLLWGGCQLLFLGKATYHFFC
jgi:hypothetical protein